MKNKLGDLDDHLFAQLERLAGEDLSAEEIEREARRADAIVALADKIADNARIKLGAAKLFAEHGRAILPMLPQIGGPAPRAEDGGEA